MNDINFAINIGRQLGSGGRVIGKRIAQELQIAYYDKEILDVAAQESGMSPEIFRDRDEQKGFLRAFFHSFVPFAGAGGDFYNNQISEEALFKIQSQAIRKIVERESSVFIGRCADYVLRNHPRTVNIFLVANEADRIRCISERKSIEVNAARKLMEQGDERRADFYNFYSSGTWGDASNYDICINTSLLGYEDTTQLLLSFIRQKLSL